MSVDGEKPTLSSALDKLFRLAQLAEAIAKRNIARVRLLLGVGLAAAALLSYEVWRAFAPSAFIIVPLSLMFSLPSLLLGYVYVTLDDALGLPRRLVETASKAKQTGVDIHSQFSAPRPQTANGGVLAALSDLRELGKSILALKAFGEEFADILSLAKGILRIANPLFFAALVFSVATIGIEGIAAVTAWVVTR